MQPSLNHIDVRHQLPVGAGGRRGIQGRLCVVEPAAHGPSDEAIA